MAKRKALGKGLRALIPEGEHEVLLTPGTRVTDVELDRIRPHPKQPRATFSPEGIAELASSIKAQGVLQPVTLARLRDGYYVVIGERRVRAAREAGLRTIPAVVRDDVDDARMLELALVENIQREDLPPLELAEAYRVLQHDYGLSQQGIAGRVGKSRASVANTLRLLGLPETVRELLSAGRITVGHAKALLGLPTSRAQVELATRAAQEGLSVRQTEDRVRRAARAPVTRREPHRLDPELARFVEEVQARYGTKVAIKKRGGRGTVEIHFYSDEELSRVLELLLS